MDQIDTWLTLQFNSMDEVALNISIFFQPAFLF